MRTFSDERGTGTFHSLGALPKRKPPAVFHIPHDVDENDDDEPVHPHSVPFPRTTSPIASPPLSPPTTPRPQLSRGASAPILLSSGKPLKPSLKSCLPSPSIDTPPETQRLHLRARSEPGTPAKNVHFPEKDYGLATIRFFERSARPVSVSCPTNGNSDETENEGEDTPPIYYPFMPTFPVFNYEIDPTKSSSVPCNAFSSPHVILESLHLPPCSFSSSGPTTNLSLTGSIFVSNLAFEKNVAVRFTLDDWQIVSEVSAHYVDSLSILPSHISPAPSTPCRHSARGWDRFTFTIRLDDYVPSLSTRTLWLACRYRIDSTYPQPGATQHGPGGEWWDNNCGENYCIAFRPAVTAPTSLRSRPRRETICDPIRPSRARPPPPMTFNEHASGFTISSVGHKTTLKDTDKLSISLPARKLSLSNYVPPTVPATSSVHLPCPRTRRNLSPSPMTNSDELSATSQLQSQSSDDTASPASSTLSTPSPSPTITPRVIINGQLATSVESHGLYGKEEHDVISSPPRHIDDWDWSSGKLSCKNGQHDVDSEGKWRHRADLGFNMVPGLDSRERQRSTTSTTPQGRKPLANNNANGKSLYDAFVTQWCFAQGPSPGRGYSNGGIMA